MKIYKDTFILNKEENTFIRAAKEKHTNLEDYFSEVLPFLETRGLRVELFNYPTVPGIKKKWNRDERGWKGSIKGKITNLLTSMEIYGSELWNSWSTQPATQEKIIEIDSGSGGGGSSFSYDSGCLVPFSMFPKLKDYINIEIEESILQKNFDNEIDSLLSKFTSDRSTIYADLINNSEDYKLLQNTLTELQNLQNKLQKNFKDIQDNLLDQAKKAASFKLPEIIPGILNISKYKNLKDCMKTSEVSREVDLESVKAAQEFIKEHAELYI